MAGAIGVILKCEAGGCSCQWVSNEPDMLAVVKGAECRGWHCREEYYCPFHALKLPAAPPDPRPDVPPMVRHLPVPRTKQTTPEPTRDAKVIILEARHTTLAVLMDVARQMHDVGFVNFSENLLRIATAEQIK